MGNVTMKKILTFAVAAFTADLPFTQQAADITSGHVFTPGEANITHVEMNAIVGGAVINPSFITDKSAASISASDVILYYSVANTDFRKVTWNNAILANTALITGQAEDSAPASGDFVLTYDASAGTFKKVTLQNLVIATTNAFYSFPTVTTNDMQGKVALQEGGTNALITVSNLFATWAYSTPFTNLPSYTTPTTNGDMLLIWDGRNHTNKQISLGAVFTNPVPITGVSNADTFVVNHTGVVATVTMQNIRGALYQTDYLQTGLVSGDMATNAWTFTTTTAQNPPAVVMLQVDLMAPAGESGAGYNAGDRILANGVIWDASRTNEIMVGWTASNYWYKVPSFGAGFPKIINRYNKAYTNINNVASWDVDIRFLYFPQ